MTIDNGEIVNRGVKSFDDTIKDLQAFQFTLTCEKATT